MIRIVDRRSGLGRQGFTLIELMIVVVIIGVLSAVALPKFSGMTQAAKEAEADPILKEVYTLQQSYYTRFNQYADVTELGRYGFLLELADRGLSDADGRYYYLEIAGTGGTGTAATYCAVAQLTTKGVDHALRTKAMGSDRLIRPGSTDCTG
jgi:prepilin-type N-terminal cleavage/methylation domain-containing protein